MPRFRAIHTIELKPDVEGEMFEDFMVREFLPAIRSLPGCLEVQLLKGYQGELDAVAHSESDYGWLTLWESVEANNAAWSREGTHHTPDQIQKVNSKLYHFAANYSLVGGYTVASTV